MIYVLSGNMKFDNMCFPDKMMLYRSMCDIDAVVNRLPLAIKPEALTEGHLQDPCFRV